MMTIALLELMNCERLESSKAGSTQMRCSAAATAAPSSPKTIDTVVEVGSPSVLKRSSSSTLPSIMPRKSIITSGKVNSEG